jgi:hypothetical protein
MKLLSFVFCWLLPSLTTARSWRQIEPLHGWNVADYLGSTWRVETNPLYTSTPTSMPTTATPTGKPSSMPSLQPSSKPSLQPSPAPSSSPTATPDPYPPNDPPANPDGWYFNYDTSMNANYGPGHAGIIQTGNNKFVVGYKNNKWGSVTHPPVDYWSEFTDSGFGPWVGILANSDPTHNFCDGVGNQSPIDIRPNGSCNETHEVRSKVSVLVLHVKYFHVAESLTHRILFRTNSPGTSVSKVPILPRKSTATSCACFTSVVPAAT